MNRTSVSHIPGLPDAFRSIVNDAPLFDSSCSPDARVWFADTDGGIFIKTAPKGTLKTEADMNAFFHSRGLGPQVLDYRQEDADWMVTRAVPGEDCLFQPYLEDPKRLSALTGTLLRQLHETDPTGCPVTDRNAQYVADAYAHHDSGISAPEFMESGTAEDAWAIVQANRNCLDSRVLLHGDYCLPNILLRDWTFSGFIDVGHGGIGDRHIDLYWGCWTLRYNLKDPRWCSRFLDAYGREDVDTEKLRILSAFEVFG